MSNFTFFHNVFYVICILKSFNNHISVVVCSFFEFETVSKCCIREWVKMSSAICFNLDQSTILSSGNGLRFGWMHRQTDGQQYQDGNIKICTIHLNIAFAVLLTIFNIYDFFKIHILEKLQLTYCWKENLWANCLCNDH